ncbi:MAG: IPT/TIG domain-containing protein [Myxococcota bacterium]
MVTGLMALSLMTGCTEQLTDAIAAPVPAPAAPTTEQPDAHTQDAAPGSAPADASTADSSGPTTPPEPLGDTLSVQTLDPNTGPSTGGLQVILTGAGFRAGLEVFFGDLPVLDTFILNQGAALVTIPAHPPGLVDVMLRHLDVDDGEPVVSPDAFLYKAELRITDITPAEGSVAGGDDFTVVGSGYTADARVFVGGRAAHDQVVVDPYTIQARTPASAAGLADVHVVTGQGVIAAEDAFLFREAPAIHALEPLRGPAEGGTLVTVWGEGLTGDAVVRFGGAEAAIMNASADADRLEVMSPAGEPGELVDVTVTTSVESATASEAWSWDDLSLDPYLLNCTHLYPASGPAAGGTIAQLACNGLQYGANVAFGDVDADILDVDPDLGLVTVEVPPGDPGEVSIEVYHQFGSTTLPMPYLYVPTPSLTLVEVSPMAGPLGGGTSVVLTGSGFTPETQVRFGSEVAADLTVLSATSLEVDSPPGEAGPITVSVNEAGQEVSLVDAFVYTDGELALALVTPSDVAIAGGTLLEILGDGFDDSTTLSIGGSPAEIVVRGGPTRLWARSPLLKVGPHSVTVTREDAEVSRENMLTAYDPRTGYSGTWGGTIQGTVNVTVYGVQGFGPIPGAFVYVAGSDGEAASGYTNEAGQVSISEAWIDGLVDVTAAAEGWTAYTIARADAKNVTVLLRPTVPSSGSPEPIEYPPDATLSGQVIGLDKYVVPPPGLCTEVTAVTGGGDCSPCDSEIDCAQDTHDCVDLAEQGSHCLPGCSVHTDCAEGYVCAGFDDDVTRCMPSPGEKIARCGVSASSVFSQDIYPPLTGWVSVGETYVVPSTRLGEVAVVCFGGYRSESGTFTATALGVRRHVYAMAGAIMDDLDVVLSHPLDKAFQFRVLDPPTWPDGVQSPQITLSIDLGADGAIPMTRPTYGGADDIWRVARQLGELSGDLYDASYAVYARISAETPTNQPTAYTFEDKIKTLVQAQLPAYDGDEWLLEASNLEQDLFAIWADPDSERATAVGANGALLFHNGISWYAQSSGTQSSLKAIDGHAWDDQWVAGDNGSVRHWDGLAWLPIEAPADNYHAIAVGSAGDVWCAGDTRLRYRDAGGTWTIEGPPSLQNIRGLARSPEGHLAAVGEGGRGYLRTPDGVWSTLTTGVTTDLVAVSISPESGELLVVGDSGVILVGHLHEDALSGAPFTTWLDLTAVAHQGSNAIIAGDAGTVIRRLDGEWSLESIPGYHTKAYGIAETASAGVLRVVGSASHILGPFIGYPVLEAPVQDALTGALTLSWTYDSGQPAQYTQLRVSTSKYAPALWTLIVGRGVNHATLPDLGLLAGLEGLGSGSRSVDLQRVRNEIFDIDDYTSREFSIYRRESWSRDQLEFYAP